MTKYEEIKNILYDIIHNKGPHDLLPSQRQLEKQYGVSSTTVQRALVDLEKEGIIYKKHGKGMFVAPKVRYFPEVHFICDSLKTTGTSEADMFPQIIEEIDRSLRENGMETIISFYKSTIPLEIQLYESLPEKRPFGAIIFSSCRNEVIPGLRKLCDCMSNVVLLDRIPTDLKTNFVSIDSYNLAYKLAKQVSKEPVDKMYICLIADKFTKGVFEKKKGFEDLAAEIGVDYSVYMVERDVEGEDKYINTMKEIINDMKDKSNVCILADNPFEPYVLYNTNKKIFKKMDRVIIGSFGRVIDINERNVDIFWVKQNVRKLAEECVNIIKENSKEMREVLVPCEIVHEKEYKENKDTFGEALKNFKEISNKFKKE